MLISIGKNTKGNMDIMGITNYPFSESDLKKSFRTLSKKYHPDKNGNQDIFIKINNAYSALKNLALPDITGRNTEDQFNKIKKAKQDVLKNKLIDDCPACMGTGFLEKKTKQYKEICCHDCNESNQHNGTVYKKVQCNVCAGTGDYKLKSGRYVDCKKCKGTGIFTLKFRCQKCNPKIPHYFFNSNVPGFIKIEIEPKTKKYTCTACSGIGIVEISVFNPVIEKENILK